MKLKKRSAPDRRVEAVDPAVEWPVHPAAPAGGIGPGMAESPEPLGLDLRLDALIAPLHPDAPASQLTDWTGGAPKRQKGKRNWIPGAPRSPGGADEEAATEDADSVADEDRKSRAAKAVDFIRDKLSANDLEALKAMALDPHLGLTMLQQDVVRKIGQFASVGDKSSVRRAVLELAERVDVSSPKDSAVLVAREGAGGAMSEKVSQEIAKLSDGKRSLEMTQGGRVLGALQSILGKNKAFEWKDGMDRGFRRLTERFGQEASGTIDVVVGAKPAGAAVGETPIGAWTSSPAGAAGPAPEPPVGRWAVPAATPGSAAEPGVGTWAIPGDAGAPGAAAGEEAPIGKWTSPGADGGQDAPVGKWVAPAQPAADSAAAQAAGPVGKWSVPAGDVGKWETPAAGAGPDAPVGKWVAPGGPGAPAVPGGADAPVGRWNQPAAGSAATGAEGPIGQWTSGGGPESGAPDDASIGKWSAPAGAGKAPAEARLGAWNVATAANPALGKWQREGDLVIADGLNLSDILRQNPNLSDVRLVELIQGSDTRQSPALKTVTTLARSVLGERFGFK